MTTSNRAAGSRCAAAASFLASFSPTPLFALSIAQDFYFNTFCSISSMILHLPTLAARSRACSTRVLRSRSRLEMRERLEVKQ